METPTWDPGRAAKLDQMIAGTSAALDETIALYRTFVATAESRELAIVGMVAHLLELAEEEEEGRGTEWIAQILAVAIYRLEQTSRG